MEAKNVRIKAGIENVEACKCMTLTQTFIWTRLEVTLMFIFLVRTMADTVTNVIQVHAHLRLPAPVEVRAGVRVFHVSMLTGRAFILKAC